MDTVLQMLAYELAAVFALLSIWLIMRNNKKGKATHNVASKAVKKLQKAKDVRIVNLSKILAEKYGLSGDELLQSAKEFQDREQELYKALLVTFVEQDGKALLSLPAQIEQAVDASLELIPIAGAATLAEIDSSSTLSEQIELTAQQLEMLMAQFRLANDEKPAKVREPESIDEKNDEIAVTETEVVAEEIETSAVELDVAGEEVEIEVSGEEELLNSLFDEIGPDEESTEVESVDDVMSADEEMSSDDVDDLLASMDDDLEIEDGIDLSDIDAKDEGEEQDLKKADAELVDDTADSANSDKKVEAEPELEAEPETAFEPELEAKTEVPAEPELEAKTEVPVEPELEAELDIEIEQPMPLNKLSDYIQGQWNNSVPDVYGKAGSELEAELDLEIEQPLPLNKLSDYIQGQWNNSVPDVYGKAGSEIEAETKPEVVVEFVAESEVEAEQEIGADSLLGAELETETNPEPEAEFVAESEVEAEQELEAESEIEAELGLEAEPKVEQPSFNTEEAMLTALMNTSETTEAIQEQIEVQANDTNLEPIEKTELEVLREKVRARSVQADIENRSEKVDVFEVIAEPEKEAGPEIEAEPELQIEPETEAEVFLENEAELNAEVKPELQQDFKVESESEPEGILELEAALEADAETEIESEPELKSEPEIKAEPEAETELHIELETDVEPEVDVEPLIEAKAQLDIEPEIEVEPEIEIEAESDTVFESSSPQLPLPDEDAIEELLTDVWNIEAKLKESGLDDSELIVEPEPELKKTEKLADAEHALEEMMKELTSEPLPSEEDLNEMMTEIRVLEQNEAMSDIEDNSQAPTSNQDELQAILSSIPSFTEMNNKT